MAESDILTAIFSTLAVIAVVGAVWAIIDYRKNVKGKDKED